MTNRPSNITNLFESLEYKKESISSKSLVDKQGGTITLFAFDRAQGLGKHSSPEMTAIQLIEGKAEITVDDNSHLVNEGEMITIPANIPIALHAIHKVKAILTRIKS